MSFRYNIFDIEFICFVLINLLYIFWLPLISLILAFILITIASVEYVELNNKPANIEYVIDYIIFFILSLIPLLHICLKNFYLYFLAKKILKKGAFKYRKLIKKVNDNTKTKRKVLLTTLIIDILIISLASGVMIFANDGKNIAFVIAFVIIIYYIFGGFFLPYFTLFKLLGIDKKELYFQNKQTKRT